MESDNTKAAANKKRSYRCNSCGNTIYRHEVFCSKCGKTLEYYDFEEE